jgi:hypothetical protein
VAVLVCQRFAQAQYSALFPPDWSEGSEPTVVGGGLVDELHDFWHKIAKNRGI